MTEEGKCHMLGEEEGGWSFHPQVQTLHMEFVVLSQFCVKIIT